MADVLDDPVTLGVLWHRLVAICDEMAASVVRTAFSSVVRESNDFACALLDRDGSLLAQYSQSIPSFTGTMAVTCRAVLDQFDVDEIRPGDVFGTNDPWIGSGHLPDLTVLTPLFVDGALIGFAGTTAHLPDIGGSSEAADAHEIYEEGLCVPLSKLHDSGVPVEPLLRIIDRNVRVPLLVRGDIEALVAANGVGARRVATLVAEYGVDAWSTVGPRVYALTDTAMRRAIATIPSGTYAHAVPIDGFGRDEAIAVRLVVGDDTVVVDFEGTSRQSRQGINSVMNYTRAYAVYALQCVLSPDLPNNEGTNRSIEVRAPEGTLLNPIHPAPVGARYLSAHFIQAAIFGALRAVIPETIPADTGNPFWAIGLKGNVAGTPFASILCFNGGQGARSGGDGSSALSMPGNVSSTPVEVIEADTPFVVERRALADGSGGAGRWAGGCGQEVVIRSIGSELVDLMLLTDRLRNPAAGIHGGEPGGVGLVQLDGIDVDEPKGRHVLQPGTVLLLRTPGGGGYGRTGDTNEGSDRA